MPKFSIITQMGELEIDAPTEIAAIYKLVQSVSKIKDDVKQMPTLTFKTKLVQEGFNDVICQHEVYGDFGLTASDYIKLWNEKRSNGTLYLE